MGADPNATMSAMPPAATDPDGAGMRTGGPVTAVPHPPTTPFPAAGSPKPKIQRARRHGDDFRLRRGRCRVFLDDHARRRGITINDFAFHAAGEEWDGRAN